MSLLKQKGFNVYVCAGFLRITFHNTLLYHAFEGIHKTELQGENWLRTKKHKTVKHLICGNELCL